jgi:phage terminase small subunit
MLGTPLKNPRWEKFCQAYVRFTATQRNAATLAADLLKRPEVRARIAELQAALADIEERAIAKAAERLALTREAVLGQHARIAFANMADYIRHGDDGRIVVDLASVERDRMAGIVELVVTERGEGEKRVSTVRIKLGERLGALTNLGKHFGLFIDKIQVDHDPIRDLTDDQLRQRALELQRKLGLAGPARPEQGAGGDGPPRGEDEG